jgi:hypothetical protein
MDNSFKDCLKDLDFPINARPVLKHSWLANQILNKSDADILFLRARENMQWEALEDEFPKRLDELSCLIQNLYDGYSTGRYVDKLPAFKMLPSDLAEEVRDTLHKCYTETFHYDKLADTMKKDFQDMREHYEDFLKIWRQPFTDDNADRLKNAWNNFLQDAKKIHGHLASLPKEIALP